LPAACVARAQRRGEEIDGRLGGGARDHLRIDTAGHAAVAIGRGRVLLRDSTGDSADPGEHGAGERDVAVCRLQPVAWRGALPCGDDQFNDGSGRISDLQQATAVEEKGEGVSLEGREVVRDRCDPDHAQSAGF
jgi:hypothetical protein